ncbi:MAG: hypothetical protein COV35_02115 [Alphaproteobacteria bacterium CG11_big_fil_rev_8_21_14_0_20_39_49]|nr:MAG: hypothetical protein COV35_02115 [Alphaproteobacteria bacterium CG11_big_fil_rev_8_21_14_0_20_39_49]
MSNKIIIWFKSISCTAISHTIMVIGATSAFFVFVLYENRDVHHKAEVASLKAEISEVKNRNDVLSNRVDFLTKDNEKYLSILQNTNNSIPFYDSKIEKLTKEIVEYKEKLGNKCSEIGSVKNLPKEDWLLSTTEDGSYITIEEKKAGSAYIDKKTGASIGVRYINSNKIAEDVTITFPDGTTKKVAEAYPGESWSYKKDNDEYRLILNKLDWASGRYTIEIMQLNDTLEIKEKP